MKTGRLAILALPRIVIIIKGFAIQVSGHIPHMGIWTIIITSMFPVYVKTG